MIERFAVPRDPSEGSPEMLLMAAWAQADASTETHFGAVQAVIGEVRAGGSYGERGINPIIHLELKLVDAVPELMTALGGLRRALDRVTGWQVSWRQPVEIDAQGAAEYVPHDGWIVGSRVGADMAHGIAALIEVGERPNARRGTYVHMADMFDIQLTPPPTQQS